MYCRQHSWRVRKKGDGSKMLKENGEVRMAVIAGRIYLLGRITVVEFRLELEVNVAQKFPPWQRKRLPYCFSLHTGGIMAALQVSSSVVFDFFHNALRFSFVYPYEVF